MSSLSSCYCVVFFFFFKQKTAYEMRISDWSSDVCSSDLAVGHDLGSTIVPVAADSDVGIGPITAQVTHRASDVPRRLLSRRRLACAQQHGQDRKSVV